MHLEFMRRVKKTAGVYLRRDLRTNVVLVEDLIAIQNLYRLGESTACRRDLLVAKGEKNWFQYAAAQILSILPHKKIPPTICFGGICIAVVRWDGVRGCSYP